MLRSSLFYGVIMKGCTCVQRTGTLIVNAIQVDARYEKVRSYCCYHAQTNGKESCVRSGGSNTPSIMQVIHSHTDRTAGFVNPKHPTFILKHAL